MSLTSGRQITQHAVQLSSRVTTFASTDPGGWGFVVERARILDEAGFDRLAISDHVVFGENLEAYSRPEVGGIAGGVQPTGPDGYWLEPMTALSLLAGVTSRIRLSTGILIAALRRPVVLAKSAATLDVLSGGRFDLGVGVGWQREEYEAAGLDFDRRGRLLDSTLEVCRALWRDQRASLHSSELTFDDIHMMPKPVRADGVPVWVSGTINPNVVARIARFGTGWIPWGKDAEDIGLAIAQMRQALADLDHDPSGLQVVGRLPVSIHSDGTFDTARTMEAVPALVEAGVTDLRIYDELPADPSAATDVAHELVARFHSVTDRPLAEAG